MKTAEKNSQKNPSQSESKAVTQPVENSQSIRLRRQKNGQYTGSLLG
jgi:hypothetical protein